MSKSSCQDGALRQFIKWCY